MKRRVLFTIGALLAAASVMVTYVLVTPRSVEVHTELTLTGSQSPAWTEVYCVPDSTLVSFDWHTSDGSLLTLNVWSTGILSPLQYRHTASSGSSSLFFYNSEVFNAVYATSADVQVLVDLSFSLNETYVSGPPSFGAC